MLRIRKRLALLAIADARGPKRSRIERLKRQSQSNLLLSLFQVPRDYAAENPHPKYGERVR
jgi:hypothetical protein